MKVFIFWTLTLLILTDLHMNQATKDPTSTTEQIEKCSPNPCQNNGTCNKSGNSFNCTCKQGYNGPVCDNKIDICIPNPCQNSGTCNKSGNSYNCTCKPGYNGPLCNNKINKCNPDPCQNNGVCKQYGSSYNCTCKAGYNGKNCDKSVTEQIPKINPSLKETNATKISYKMVIVMNFTEQLKNKSSTDYKNASRNAKLQLEQKFKSKTKEQNLTVNVTGFEKGSVVILYEVTLQTYGKTSKQLIELDNELYEAATKWNGSRVLDKIVDERKTRKAVKKKALIQNICSCPVPFICEEEGDQLMCKHRCGSNEKIECGAHGQCVYDLKRKLPICHCTKSKDTLYYGERCEHSTSNLQSLPSKLTILAISGGVGGALLLIIFISTVCFCYRLKNAKQRRSFSETSSKYGSDIVRENQKMENIPLEYGKDNPSYREEQHELGRRFHSEQPHTTKSNPLYRDDFEDQRKRYQTDQEPRQQGHNRISRGSINTQASNNRPRTESSGYRQPMKNNYYNDSESSYRDQRESENSYRPRDFNSERNNPRGRPEEISRDRNNSKGWLEESSNDRNKPMGRSEEFIGDRNNPRRWPEEKSNDRTYQRERSEESSIRDDRYVYIDGDGGVRRLFKRVDDKELGGETLIYQPSNMPRPIQRENVDSVGDNFIMRPAPPQDNERRSSFYDTIDSENPYKIKRPVIRHNNLYS